MEKMIIIGELINSSRSEIQEAMKKDDGKFLQDLVQKQVDAGASFIDINTGTFMELEKEKMDWMIDLTLEVTDIPPCIDSPDPKVIEFALNKVSGKAMINSISLEKDRIDPILPLVKEYQAHVIALCMDDTGMPETADDRLKIVDALVERMTKEGVRLDQVYFDPLIKPISVNKNFGMEVLDTITEIKKRYPSAHITCGLSNISYGLPNRSLLNQAFLVLCMGVGLDSVIMDPLDKNLLGILRASMALLGQDDYCMQYLACMRKG